MFPWTTYQAFASFYANTCTLLDTLLVICPAIWHNHVLTKTLAVEIGAHSSISDMELDTEKAHVSYCSWWGLIISKTCNFGAVIIRRPNLQHRRHHAIVSFGTKDHNSLLSLYWAVISTYCQLFSMYTCEQNVIRYFGKSRSKYRFSYRVFVDLVPNDARKLQIRKFDFTFECIVYSFITSQWSYKQKQWR